MSSTPVSGCTTAGAHSAQQHQQFDSSAVVPWVGCTRQVGARAPCIIGTPSLSFTNTALSPSTLHRPERHCDWAARGLCIAERGRAWGSKQRRREDAPSQQLVEERPQRLFGHRQPSSHRTGWSARCAALCCAAQGSRPTHRQLLTYCRRHARARSHQEREPHAERRDLQPPRPRQCKPAKAPAAMTDSTWSLTSSSAHIENRMGLSM